MNWKKAHLLLASSFLLWSAFAPLSTALATNYDTQIAEQKAKLNQLANSVSEQSQEVNTLLSEISTVEQKIATVQDKLQQAQQEMEFLTQESLKLDELIDKRHERIDEQALFLQTNDTAGTFIDIFFSSESFVDGLSKFFAMTQLIGASYDMLEQQRLDQIKLAEQQKELEAIALNYSTQVHELASLKNDLLVKTTAARSALTALQIQKAKATDDLATLQKQKAEAEEAARIAAENARKQAEEQRRQQQIAEQARLASSSSTSSSMPARRGEYILPISGPVTVTSPFGHRHLTLENGADISGMHKGIDLVNGDKTTPIYSIAAGTVVFSGYSSGGGNAVIIKMTNGIYATYLHLSKRDVTVGQVVTQGQKIGNMGNTGYRTTGAHLHLELSTGIYSGQFNPAPHLGL